MFITSTTYQKEYRISLIKRVLQGAVIAFLLLCIIFLFKFQARPGMDDSDIFVRFGCGCCCRSHLLLPGTPKAKRRPKEVPDKLFSSFLFSSAVRDSLFPGNKWLLMIDQSMFLAFRKDIFQQHSKRL